MMAVSVRPEATQIAVLEGRNLIEHYVSRPADDVAQIHGNIYLGKVQNRLTLLGGLFLGAVAIIPSAVESATQVKTFQGLGATSLLILVGVAIDTAKQVQTYVISQRYEGMVRQ